MKKTYLLPCTAAGGGIAAFLLRLWQQQAGFEPDTGLAATGHPAGWILLALLAVLVVLCFLFSRQLPKSGVFPKDFALTNDLLLGLVVAGVFLLALSGIVDLLMGAGLFQSIAAGAYPDGLVPDLSTPFPSSIHMLFGVLTLASAIGLLLAALECRHGEDTDGSISLLLPVTALVIRLVFIYRIESINPTLQAYYVSLLALVLLILGFYRLSSHAFGAGNSRRFGLYGSIAVVLSIAAVADSLSVLSSALLYAGGAAAMLGFLLLRAAND